MAVIPKDIHMVKISLPTKRVLEALKTGDHSEIIDACKELCLGISHVMNGPWITNGIFQGLKDLDLWASSIKKEAEHNLKK